MLKFFHLHHLDVYSTASDLSRKFKSTFKFWVGPFLFLIVKDADDIKIALNSEFCSEKPSIFYKPYSNFALLTMGGNMYKLHRKNINPLFYPAFLKSLLPIINSKMQSFLERFDSTLNQNAFDFSIHSMEFTLDTILATMFGRNDVDEDVRRKFVHDFEQ